MQPRIFTIRGYYLDTLAHYENHIPLSTTQLAYQQLRKLKFTEQTQDGAVFKMFKQILYVKQICPYNRCIGGKHC